jgi:23S rRNA (adenine2030-N6)-methyltransferase
MANRHYGNIGDIWKHLPLAEMLAIERPKRYWESHAGSSEYTLGHSPARDYGVFHFVRSASESLDLAGSSFLCLLEGLRTRNGHLRVYPGSPRIAMEMLRDACAYLFCDLDGASLKTIGKAAHTIGIPAANLKCVEADGVATVLDAASGLTAEAAAATLILIDPCAGDDPFVRREARPSPMDAFSRTVAAGARVVLWYGFSSAEDRAACWDGIKSSLTEHGVDVGAAGLWSGEICLREITSRQTSFDPGVRGCGLLCGNLRSESICASSRLGHELARVYANAALPDGTGGALDFRSVNLEMAAAGGW